MLLLKIIFESIRQAFRQLVGNKLRSFLSLLGVTIGIFCIIGVQSAVDSLEDNIRGSIEKLGDDVLYIQKMPWNEDPGKNFWKYMRRPNPSYDDFKAIEKKVSSAAYTDYHVFFGEKTLKYRNSSAEEIFAVAVTYDFINIFNVEFGRGRYYTSNEYHHGLNKVLIGGKVASQLFGAADPIGREIKFMGHKVEVIGVFEEAGKDLLQVMNFDESIIVSYELARKLANVKNDHPFGSAVNVKAEDGIVLQQLKDEITGVLRAERRLKPREENNFALNNISMLASIMDSIFGSINMAAWFIGGFAIFVGMFSVANIMFVSVKERTNIVGIKKALGAKKFMILLEFLIEAIVLCILGGILGLGTVWILLKALSGALPFEVYLGMGNIIFGISLSIFVGVVSGLIPAIQAANMDPVDAIRA